MTYLPVLQLTLKAREALYILCVLSATALTNQINQELMLSVISKRLSLNAESMADKYHAVLRLNHSHQELLQIALPYVDAIQRESIEGHILVFELLHVLLVNNMYNASGRVLMKTLSSLLCVSRESFVWLEENLSIFLNTTRTESTQLHTDKADLTLAGYLMVGASMIVVGSAAAVAGSMAAPALAASAGGLIATSGTTNAVLTSAASYISGSVTGPVFGAIGAGLAGYKMTRRLQGLDEFELEQHNAGHLAVCVLVSGWMSNDTCDYQRAFGMLPTTMYFRERLIRYFQQHAPSRLDEVDELSKAPEEQVCLQLIDELGFDPRKAEHITAMRHDLNVSTELFDVFSALQSEMHKYAAGGVPGASLPFFPADDAYSDHAPEDAPRAEMPLPYVAAPVDGEDPVDEEQYWSWQDSTLAASHELLLLRWETALQRQLGDSVKSLFRSVGINIVKSKVLAAASLEAVNHAMSMPLSIIKLTDFIDSAWSVAARRAELAGRELALALLHRYETDARAVSLVGYSMGSALIVSCLRYLAEYASSRADHHGSQMVEDVILLGSPVSAHAEDWLFIKSIVNGRLVNGFSENDLVLRFLYRMETLTYSLAGVSKVECEGVENFDLSAIIHKHADYCVKIKDIMHIVDIDCCISCK